MNHARVTPRRLRLIFVHTRVSARLRGLEFLALNVSFFFLVSLQSPSANPWKDPALDKLSGFCEERRSVYDWVPTVTLPER